MMKADGHTYERFDVDGMLLVYFFSPYESDFDFNTDLEGYVSKYVARISRLWNIIGTRMFVNIKRIGKGLIFSCE